MAAIYELRNEDGVVQLSFSVQLGIDKWVLTSEDVVKDKSFVKSFQIKPPGFSHILRIIGENIDKDGDGKIQFKEQNAETLMEVNRINIITKQYGGIVSKFLTLYTEVLSNEEKFADKLEIYLQGSFRGYMFPCSQLNFRLFPCSLEKIPVLPRVLNAYYFRIDISQYSNCIQIFDVSATSERTKMGDTMFLNKT